MKSIIKYVYLTLILMTITSISQADVLLKDTHGQSTSFSALKGKWVLINYWASWCQTCVDEIPEFNRFYKRHKEESVALYAVNFDALPLFQQRNLIKRFNINYPNLLKDPSNELRLGDITGVPVTFIFNPQGRLVKTLYGGQTAKTLEQVIAANS
ncbi:TlpA disulfide reductase family protein [Legionella fallonii]|uniref:Thiol-disulfide oxidoreductase n=1 Tax=Legionella fallonii LLAP-10 TaxID=1212491 RepID=A0A098G0L1_9GAMM|nr:TlpA disulfide reductase family protein [Legionella fallonii]CEG55504.1 Thiol-disulfide oxidoreductase [Legionella fallonii LLAP-10]